MVGCITELERGAEGEERGWKASQTKKVRDQDAAFVAAAAAAPRDSIHTRRAFYDFPASHRSALLENGDEEFEYLALFKAEVERGPITYCYRKSEKEKVRERNQTNRCSQPADRLRGTTRNSRIGYGRSSHA